MYEILRYYTISTLLAGSIFAFAWKFADIVLRASAFDLTKAWDFHNEFLPSLCLCYIFCGTISKTIHFVSQSVVRKFHSSLVDNCYWLEWGLKAGGPFCCLICFGSAQPHVWQAQRHRLFQAHCAAKK